MPRGFGIEYKDGGFELIHIPNGRITKKQDVNKYQYHLADHLGNIVVLFEDVNEDGKISIEEDPNNPDNEILQRNHYYSFGMRVEAPHFGLVAEPKGTYLYNGKENHEELGLDWLSYGFRMYDPVIGRFPSVDPIADKFAFVSGFNYAENMVPRAVDLYGLQAFILDPIQMIEGTKKIMEGIGVGLLNTFGYITQLGNFHVSENARELGNEELACELECEAKNAAAMLIVEAATARATSGIFSSAMKLTRHNLAKSWMKYDNYLKFVDFDKPIYTKTLKKGTELIQYRTKGSEGTIGNFYARKGTSPEQIGLDPSDIVGDPITVTVKKKTKVLVTTHKKNATYYKDDNITLKGDEEQIFSRDLKNNIEINQ